MNPAPFHGVAMPGARTFYEVLDIPADATVDAVEQAYRRALEVFGADSLASYALFSPEESERARAEIERAYAVLHDRAARAAYDAALNSAPDKGAATTTFTATFDMPTQGSTSMSDLSMRTPPSAPAPAPTPDPPAAAPEHVPERRTSTSRMVLIATPVEEVRSAPAEAPPPTAPSEPAVVEAPPPPPPPPPPPLPPPPPPPPAPVAAAPTELAPLPPPGPAVEAAPPAPAPSMPSSVPISLSPTEPPPAAKFRRVRADDDSLALRVARASGGTLPPADVETATTAAPLPEEGEINGSTLQRLRETRGFTHRQVSDATKVSVHYLKAMEQNQFSDLPTRVYLRGFLVQLARAYRVSPDRLAQGYLAFAERYRNQLK